VRPGNAIPGGGILYTVEGDSVAFGCSWDGTKACSTAQYLWYIDYMRDNCGVYRGGYIAMGDWKKQYGMQLKREITCGHWVGSESIGRVKETGSRMNGLDGRWF